MIWPLSSLMVISRPSFLLDFSSMAWPARPPRTAPTTAPAVEPVTRVQANAERVVQQVRAAVAAELHRGAPTLATVARRLATSARTLQRRLDAQGQRFQEIVEATRFELARRYLAVDDVTVPGAQRLPLHALAEWAQTAVVQARVEV